MSDAFTPHLGQPVIYYDDDRQPFAAIVAHTHPRTTKNSDRPVCNLATLKRDGRVANRVQVEPAYHDGVKWVLLNKWALPGEIPDDEWNYLPPPAMRIMKVGAGEHIPTH